MDDFKKALSNYKTLYILFGTFFILLAIPLTFNLATKSDEANHSAHAATSIPNCWPSAGTGFAGTLAGQPNAIWCYTDYGDGGSTAVKGNNSWVDNFNHGLTLSKFNADVIIDSEGYPNFRGRPNIQDYTDFPETGSICKSQLFRHGNHWMRDIAGHDQGGEGSCAWDFGGAVMSPNKTFRAEKPDGTICTPQNVDTTCKLVIEADAATRVAAYGGNLFWPEFVITTADHPVRIRQNGTYDYEFFPNSWTLGCRLQNDGGFTCALLDDGPGGDTPSRVYELSHFQCGNSEDSPHPGSVYGCNQKYGGLPSNLPADIAGHSRDCESLDPDVNCRDRWRWEITNNKLTWYANGAKYMEHWDFEPAGRTATSQLLTQPVYVYFGEFMFKLGKPARMHWDRIAINPKNAAGQIVPPSVAETFCLGQPNNTCGGTTPPPPPGGGGNPPPPTPASGTIDFNDRATGGLSGEYPAGVASWGSGWIVANPFGGLTTKNVSFNGATVTSATFTFASARRLVSIQAGNGGSAASTVTLSCAGNTTKTQSVAAGATVTISTGWTANCTAVTVGSSNSWDTNFDNIVYDTAGGSPPGGKVGDLNNDGFVNILDLSLLLSKFGTSDAAADINKDGKVDTLDLSALLSKWGT